MSTQPTAESGAPPLTLAERESLLAVLIPAADDYARTGKMDLGATYAAIGRIIAAHARVLPPASTLTRARRDG